MSENAEQYQSRLESYLGDRDPVVVQSETCSTLARMISGLPGEVLSRSPAPGKWSVAAILAHMAEDELTSTWRYRQMIERDGAPLPSFDQDLWARLGDYPSWSANDALELFRLSREANLRMFARLTPEEWQRTGVHAERGPTSVAALVRHMACHDLNHLEQIRRIIGAQTGESYAERLAGLLGQRDPIEVQSQTYEALVSLTNGLSTEIYTRSPGAGKWSIAGILTHLAEDEMVSSHRYRQIIETDGVALNAADQDLWARVGDYDSWPREEALDLFRITRNANLRMFARLTPEEWQHTGVHSTRGRTTLTELVRHTAGHDLNHLAQIRSLLSV